MMKRLMLATQLLATAGAEAAELRLELDGKGMAGGKFGPPDFAEAVFEVGESAVTKSIHLR